MSTVKLAKIISQDLGYCEPTLKKSFHTEAKSVLRKVAKKMGLVPSDYKINSNMSGIACSGDVVMHTDSLYISISQRIGGERKQVLYRIRKDVQSGRNNYTRAKQLLDDNIIAEFSRLQIIK